MTAPLETCPGCGARLAPMEGPTHPYMTNSPSCWHAFGRLLAAEYGDARLMEVHRLGVDTYAVQHPGDGADRRAIQSVGLHLARLWVQLESPRGAKETNEVMLGFAARKGSLIALAPPAAFSMTVADVAPHAGTPAHAGKLRQWARATWEDWAAHHDYIRSWVAEATG